ncbi:MAG UNVERIFIED_CONTAM: hypothetical protein LVT10_11990, partial [Anaerolineae bacterium]
AIREAEKKREGVKVGREQLSLVHILFFFWLSCIFSSTRLFLPHALFFFCLSFFFFSFFRIVALQRKREASSAGPEARSSSRPRATSTPCDRRPRPLEHLWASFTTLHS